jgi:hypothetical protein
MEVPDEDAHWSLPEEVSVEKGKKLVKVRDPMNCV